MNTKNQEIKKSRMTRYFIDAVKELSKSVPIQSITLRDVANEAGFNSATLYNYFKNMDQLIHITLFDTVTDLWIEDTKNELIISDPLKQYLSLWRVQCNEAFKNPNLFLYFFVMKDKQVVYDTAEIYFSIFSNKKDLIGKRFLAQLPNPSFVKKNINYFQPCIEAGYFKEESISEIVRNADILFGGMLLQAIRMSKDIDSEELTQCFFECLDTIIEPLLLKKPN